MQDIQEIIEYARDYPTIVEGKNDKIALEELGFYDIYTLEAPIYKIIELFDKGATIQILTDLDKKGKELYAKIFHECCQRGIRVDNTLREELFKGKLSHIEGLSTWLRNHAA